MPFLCPVISVAYVCLPPIRTYGYIFSVPSNRSCHQRHVKFALYYHRMLVIIALKLAPDNGFVNMSALLDFECT
jgi:hypothetical protein